ncbi:hypothetical protein COU00_04395 [Candidatus Falkowbacteria bacterium CG10_big_fil_rev_8_21_14_0_10_43_11]|uniref:Uncharacterized protein n=1 Tax=Candidatus Falkowbacteria bacterium CG10_big_fil_rev_8_21_14_0_10_43_11 TaxID=1974568 RepID=A0A2M6WKZ0_9BACT|nr:MAG: hypothetical protein COU00_04395 [Candidatus Falkowbacteria bacterium CG10_big_fil_rev_8_21_14_0_10_43_11]
MIINYKFKNIKYEVQASYFIGSIAKKILCFVAPQHLKGGCGVFISCLFSEYANILVKLALKAS